MNTFLKVCFFTCQTKRQNSNKARNLSKIAMRSFLKTLKSLEKIENLCLNKKAIFLNCKKLEPFYQKNFYRFFINLPKNYQEDERK